MPKQWVIPDIHGCYYSLKALIEDQIMPSADDTLMFLGDFVDRGPQSKQVLDYVMGIEQQGCYIVALKGNHEDFFIKAWDEERNRKSFLFFKQANWSKNLWLKHGGKEALESFETDDLSAIPEQYIEWMRKLPLYYETGNYVLVHAGLNFKNNDPFQDEWAMLWLKDYKIIPSKIGNRRLIHGHTPVNLEFIDISVKNSKYPFIDLDNGCYMTNRPGFGNLVALELHSMELKIQPNLDME
ncbi:MAG: metallophosphoesterase [Lentimicrobium sp.]|nr:metallophosphoesterase [Lentimicrobium sp.]